MLTAVLAGKLLGDQYSILSLMAIGAVLSLAAQLGDLVESVIKRDCDAKDAGTFMPGLGGLLDVLDSLVFTAPVFYWLLKYVL